MSKASEAKLSELHGALADALKASLYDSAGNINSSVLSVARQFLKDNHIESDTGEGRGALAGLANLPVFDDDEHNVVPIRKNG